MTVAERVKDYLLEKGDWVVSYDLIKHFANNYSISADRAARKLAEKGEIEREQRGKFVYFRKRPDIVKRFEALQKKPIDNTQANLF